MIEDEGATRRALAQVLASQGYRVLESDCIAVGFNLFQTEKPDLVVLDINLPDGNGLDFCKKVRAHKTLAATPVIMLTGRGQFDDKTAGFEAGDLTIDPAAHLVRFGDVTISNLTTKEFDLFYALAKKGPKVLSRQWILSSLWRTVAVDNLVDAHMSKLRRKLPQALADRLQAVPGKGFRYFT